MYYRLYAWNLRVRGKKDLPQWNALFAVTVVMLWNLFFLIGVILGLFFEINIFDLYENTPKKYIIIMIFVSYGINYFVFMHKGKYKVIGEKYKDEPLRKKRINMVLLYLYALVSFALFAIPAFVW